MNCSSWRHKGPATRAAALTIVLFLGLAVPKAWTQNTVETIAGGGPNHLPALKSSLGSPSDLVLDKSGNIYIANPDYGQVLKLDTLGNVTLVAGNGSRGGFLNSDGGAAVNARLILPKSVAVDISGNVFIADETNCKVREVSAQTGKISTVAGTGSCGYSGDGGPAASAMLNDPSGVAIDKLGNILIADSWNCLVREVSAQTGNITTIAGTPQDMTGSHCGYSGDGGLADNAELGIDNNLAVDSLGNIFIADSCRIREVSTQTGIISTVAGQTNCGYSGDGGLATNATLEAPYGVAIDTSGDIFIADTSNCVIRKVSSSNLQISTVAGNYSVGCGYSGDGRLATNAHLNQPYGVAVDSSGNILIADHDNSVIREVSAATGNISTFAGVAVPDPNHPGGMIGFPAYSGDGYIATDAVIGFLNTTPYASGLAVDPSGNIFIADTPNHAIREVSASTGTMTTVAGYGLIGYSGDGGPASGAQFFYPRDVATDSSGNIYIVDSGNCVIRKITASTGIISTVAGTLPDSSGNYFCGYAGDGGPATSAQLNPFDIFTPAGGLAVDSSGNIFIADTGNGVIREVSASTGIITTVAGIAASVDVGTGDGGPATSATLFSPYGVAVDNSGNIFIADTWDFAIREVVAANGNIYTVAGEIGLGGFSGDGGPATAAQIGLTFGLFLDPAGNLFIPDPDNCVIREVSANGIITTAAGTPNRNGDYFCGYSGDGGPALSAVFDSPGVARADSAGDLVVLDDIRVRTIAGIVQASGAGAVAFPNPLVFRPAPVGTSNALTVILSNRGSFQNNVSTVTISGTNASTFSETDNCVGRTLAAAGDSCVINVKFFPSVAGTESALLTMTDSTATQIVNLSGAGSDFSVGAASNGSTSATVTAGQSANYSLQVNPVSGFTGNVTLACSGAPAQSTCFITPGVDVIGNTPASFTVTVNTTAPSARAWGASLASSRRLWPLARTTSLLALSLLAGIIFLGARAANRKGVWASLCGSLCLLVVLSACGGGSGGGGGGGGGGNSGTPHGTYTLTVTGTQQALSRSLQLTLDVN